MRLKKYFWTLIGALLIGTAAPSAIAETTAVEQPKLVIIVDNLGDQEQTGIKAANLPGQVACSILPHARYSAKIAGLCHAQSKTVILNTPMQAKNNYPLGQGGLYADMSKQQFMQTLQADMASIPYLQGLDNHMGSLLTSQEQPMNWLMEAIQPHGLFFLDNKTSPHSAAKNAAKNNQVPFISRDIFLDDVRTPEAIHKQFNEALKVAKRYGVAVIVAHPYAASLDFLQTTLPTLEAQGYQLVSIPQALDLSIEPVTLSAAKTAAVPIKEPVKPVATAVKPVVEKSLTQTTRSTTTSAPVKNQSVQDVKPSKSIDVPAITDTAPQMKIEVTVNKNREVVVNTLDQSTAPINNVTDSAAKIENTPLTLPVQPAAEKPGLFSRAEDELAGLFHKRKTDETAKPVNEQTTLVKAPEKVITKPAAVKPQPVTAAAANVTAEQATAKASHSLAQTLQNNLCKKYNHFCSHTEQATVTQPVPAANKAFNQLQGKLPWPTAGKIITRFGAELGENKLKYNGVLIQAPTGQPIHAISNGRIIFANWLSGLGLLLIIDHGNGYMSLYGHNEALYKKVGDEVKANDLIAAVGDSGVPGPAGLYFEIRHNGQPVNPEQWCG